MNSLVLITALLGKAPEPADGTLLFLEHCKSIVEHYTDSTVSHVAVVVYRQGKPWVYEATPPKVRRIPLSQYLREIGTANRSRDQDVLVWSMTPRRHLSDRQKRRLQEYLDAQIGQRYSTTDYVRKRQTSGIHCAELAAQALDRAGGVDFSKPHLESPASLLAKIRSHYEEPVAVPVSERKPNTSWCSRTWKKVSLWCGWSCREAWAMARG